MITMAGDDELFIEGFWGIDGEHITVEAHWLGLPQKGSPHDSVNFRDRLARMPQSTDDTCLVHLRQTPKDRIESSPKDQSVI